MTFVERDAVERMAAGLQVLALDEEDVDGDSFVGPKHWHVFDLVARRPTGWVSAPPDELDRLESNAHTFQHGKHRTPAQRPGSVSSTR